MEIAPVCDVFAFGRFAIDDPVAIEEDTSNAGKPGRRW
jgi:hypothetical protein